MLDEQIVKTSLAEEVYKRIRLAIFQNIYGDGEQLNINQIAKVLGVSRQPVVEAITRLSLEGLVETRPRIGTFVKKLSLLDVSNIMDTRLMIETFALAHADIRPEKLSSLEKLIDEMDLISRKKPFDYLEFNERDIQFHQGLVELSENNFLINMYCQLNSHYVIARAFYSNALQTTLTQYGQHRNILNLLQIGDKYQAKKVLEEHILRAKRQLIKIFNEIDCQKPIQ